MAVILDQVLGNILDQSGASIFDQAGPDLGLVQYATVQNAPYGVGTLTPILIDPATVTWDSQHAPGPPDWVPCWIVWNTAHNQFKGIGWYQYMPQYIVPAAVELGGQNSPFPAQPTLL